MANRVHNNISSIKNEARELQTSHKAIEAMLIHHFQGITQENILDREKAIREITRNIPKLVCREDNFNLVRPVTEGELRDVIQDMQNGKALGLDDFNVDFFKACWNIVKRDILNVLEDSRPIALCNRIYKIISKVVANRLKPLLIVLVSGEQSGYVEGKQILDNIIQAQEVVHSLTSKKQVGMIMQLDIAKAYDKVNWLYLKKMLIAFGFDHIWVRWAMALVTSSSFSILVSGSPSEIFSPSRGLRQGDPLSPFLFIIMMEGLGRAINQAQSSGNIKGLQLTDNG
eukprot:PITA_21835